MIPIDPRAVLGVALCAAAAHSGGHSLNAELLSRAEHVLARAPLACFAREVERLHGTRGRRGREAYAPYEEKLWSAHAQDLASASREADRVSPPALRRARVAVP